MFLACSINNIFSVALCLLSLTICILRTKHFMLTKSVDNCLLCCKQELCTFFMGERGEKKRKRVSESANIGYGNIHLNCSLVFFVYIKIAIFTVSGLSLYWLIRSVNQISCLMWHPCVFKSFSTLGHLLMTDWMVHWSLPHTNDMYCT